MKDQQNILVTGVAGYWGVRVAEKLLKQPAYHVIGLDMAKPGSELAGLDFIQADLRDTLLVELLKLERVNIVCHLSFQEAERPSEAVYDHNVNGTIKLFNACAEADVHKIILRSSTTVYGARPENSAFLAETHPLRTGALYEYNRDFAEIEAFYNKFQRQHVDIGLSILRFANIVGPTAPSPMTRYLRDPLAPRLLGFDPMMQVIHEDDVVGALVHFVESSITGAFNIAAEGVMPLTQMTNQAGKIPIPIPHLCAYLEVGLIGAGGLGLDHHMPIEPDYLRYPCVGDTNKMQHEMGFTPHYSAAEALSEFTSRKKGYDRNPSTETKTSSEEQLRAELERRKMEGASQENAQGVPVEGY
jgi:UDP-glucose 4-epimerase